MRTVKIENSWKIILNSEFRLHYMQELSFFLRSEKDKGKKIFPPASLIFNAFNYTPYKKVKVIILGQDPYHGYGQAHGLSFSVPNAVTVPPSLINIFKELQSDLGIPIPKTGNLESWARQGVLLLNSCLTVEKGIPASHVGKGWERFTDKILSILNDNKKNLVFILWGKKAREKGDFLNREKHLVLESSHPSPYSSNYGFFGSKPFSKTNSFLVENGTSPINW